MKNKPIFISGIKNTFNAVKAPFENVLPKKNLIEEQPLRAELFSIDQFELHAKALAKKHTVSFKKGPEKLLSRLQENAAILLQAYDLLNEAGNAKRRISPAGEWLLDNYYLIEEQIRLAQKFLPKGYSRQLPNLIGGPMYGYPRVYDIATEIVSHSDGRLDIKGLSSFIASYQTVKHLKLGELWGVPIMLRLALIENLRRVSIRMKLTQIEADKADYWASRILEVSVKDANDVVLEIASMAKAGLPMSDSFVAEFVRRLHGQSSALNLPLIWLEKKLSEQGETIDRLIQSTSQKQAADQVSIANSIESLRLLEVANWHDFVESSSLVETILKNDPSGDYAEMSFATRDSYRHIIEILSLQGAYAEEEIASRAVQIAAQAKASAGSGDVRAHVGYYLVDKGLLKFYDFLGLRPPLRVRFSAKTSSLPLTLYIGFIALTTFLSSSLALLLAWNLGLHYWIGIVLFGFPLVIVTSQTAVSMVNWLSTVLVKPKSLPKMDFSKSGVPALAHTLAVIPAMLSNGRTVESLIENIEVRYLANSDPNVDFALLTDFSDASQEIMLEDDALLASAREGIENLNLKYRRNKENTFYLFHRNRRWNETEKVWIGYERKRGKLSQLNSLLRGDGKNKFSVIVGEPSQLQDVKYVITMDADTNMPRDSARNLIEIISHPLNKPQFDDNKQRVTSGYGILQPRVEASYPGENPSLFVKLYGGDSGIDPYTHTVSDVYQDMFDEGSFIGKGLYDVDAFEKCLKGRFPENLILSHDLLEGCYARSALVTDVQLYEEYPSGYFLDVNRRRRWIRGDWQIVRWLLSRVPDALHRKVKNPISVLSQWKLLDNLRRSMVPAATSLMFLSGWLFLQRPWLWTCMIIIFAGLPMILMSLINSVRKPQGISVHAHFGSVFSSLSAHAVQFFLSLAFIIYEAYVSVGAIATTFWRMLISRKRLLEWTASGETHLSESPTFFDSYKKMFIAPLVVLIYASVAHMRVGAPEFIMLSLWALSPAIACFISRPNPYRRSALSQAHVQFLRRQARKTWKFFETFVTSFDNWLPPDNFQEEPVGALAHRTSPTNVGLYLLSNLAAYDFGYVSMGTMFNRAKNTLNTINGMAKFKGHLYNWYDTVTLKPLAPLYISSVDSGNFCGHLLVLRSGFLEMQGRKIAPEKIFEGLADTLSVLRECLHALRKNNMQGDIQRVTKQIQLLGDKIAAPPASLSQIHALLRQLSADISIVVSELEKLNVEKVKAWAHAFEKQCNDHLNDISFIAPWTLLPPEIPNARLAKLHEELRKIDEIITVGEVARLEAKLMPLIDGADDAENDWLSQLRVALKTASARASERIKEAEYVVLRCGEMSVVEYDFLYNKDTRLLSIGYNVGEHKADSGNYDLLASEARLGSFVGIAQGKIPQEHWFMLGRLLSKHGGGPVLISWGGSMFEYLMPLLVMPNYDGTLLDRTYKAVIKRQIDYALRNNIPWGISESGYNKIDAAMAYQYRSFGVPDTGFKRGLSEDLVVSPYACALALMVEPEKACRNLENLYAEGFSGEYGFYEALDYTPSRLAPNESLAVVKSFMAHHQGMSFLSFAYVLLNRPMQRRFLADPMFKATELLLQERVPKEVPFLYDVEITGSLRKAEEREALLRVFTNPDTPIPEIHLLSNGNYSVMITNCGGGYSRWKDIALTRWREDSVSDKDGAFVYLRDIKTGEFWSTAYQPTLKRSKYYEAVFSRSRAEFKRRDHYIDTHTEIAVSPEDDIELRRVKVTNRSREKRIIELTSYAEVVLNQPAADQSHQAFSNLFVQTEIIRPHQAIICTRRPRSEKDIFPYMLHLMAVHGNSTTGASYETDRSKFIGRRNTLANPAAMQGISDLAGSEGNVIDPIVSIRCRIELEPEGSATIDYITGVCDSREAAQRLMEKYRDRNLADRVFDLAWTDGEVALQQINATESDAQLYGRLASSIVYANPAWRANASILKLNFRGQSDLWGYSISGDLPIVLVRVEDIDNIDLIARMVQAHSYWRMKGLAVDLVIWNEDNSVYRDILSEKINGLISANAGGPPNKPGGIFLRRSDQISEEHKILLQTVARIILTDRNGTLAEQIAFGAQARIQRPQFSAVRNAMQEKMFEGISERSDLTYFNGLGGFTRDGREYVITTSHSNATPAPWANVLANENFGSVISESGSAYTWSENAHEFRLTPWKNDPVTDACGEALYIRDEETGQFWSPTPLPAGGKTRYVSRHGFGYSIFEHSEIGIATELSVFVSLESAVKFALLKFKNVSGRKRRLSAASYNELVMGTFRDKCHMHIVTEMDPKCGALLAYNHYNQEFPNRVIFLDCSEPTRFVSGDRFEFLGRNGAMAAPAAMQRDRLSGKCGAGFDPCACMQVYFELDGGEEKEISFSFGAGKSLDDARSIVQRFSGVASIRRELENVWEYWKRNLGVVYVETPDDSINFLVNGWLQYQTISCRLWGRSGYYQSGGAYGFRDQLQDVMSLMHSHPQMARKQLLAFAEHQFVEGDVQHWWHPPSGRGTRSRCSDDYLWLPLVACQYVEEIGDTGVLDETINFLEGRALKPGEESYYDLPVASAKSGTLYEHCVEAVKRALKFGVHGLPLMGSGDWNDGMNLVGIEGKGESVWLAFFLCKVLFSVAKVAAMRKDKDFSQLCLSEAGKLSRNIEKYAWDGQWYLRAYYDNGETMGSSLNSECLIDSIPQSWAVISGAASRERAIKAMLQVDQLLVDRKNNLIKLFEPPFDACACDPGYIKGYVPGVRENGGQYTHAAVWAAIAFAILKDRKRAWELLSIINPVLHSGSPDKRDIYKVEPYVMAADVYALKSNAGRGGWTWYTGSASWMYQLIVKHLLGIRLKVDHLYFEPCLPEGWKSFKLHYRYRETFYHITIQRSGPNDHVVTVTVDGIISQDKTITLVDDRTEHSAEVIIA